MFFSNPIAKSIKFSINKFNKRVHTPHRLINICFCFGPIGLVGAPILKPMTLWPALQYKILLKDRYEYQYMYGYLYTSCILHKIGSGSAITPPYYTCTSSGYTLGPLTCNGILRSCAPSLK